LLILFLLLIYGNSFHGAFHFDDMDNIVDNPNVQADRLSLEDLSRAVHGLDRSTGAGIHRPVSFLTLAANHALNGIAPFGYHLVNFSIHAIAALVLFFLTLRILRLTPFGRNRPAESLIGIALLSAGLWASHPIQVTAVTYIVQRMTGLAALFTMISMYSYIKARTAEGGISPIVYGAVCLLSGLLAVGSKENAAMLPINLALVEIFLFSASRGQRRKYVWVVMGGALLLVAAAGFLLTGPANLLAGYESRPFSLGQRLMTEPRVFLFYISLLLYPVSDRFTMLHDVTVSTGLFSPWTTLPAIVLVLGLPAVAFFLRNRLPLLSFSFLFFWVNHLIEGTVVPLEIVFEHRNYLPSIFFFLPMAAGFVWLLERYPRRHLLTISASALVTFFLFSQGHTVRMRNELFDYPLLLWGDNVKKSPGLHRPHHNLSSAYFAVGEPAKAVAEARKALAARAAATRRQKYITWYNLGTYHLYIGELAEASECFFKALEIEPRDPKIYHKIAAVKQIQGDLGAAEIYVREALRLSRGAPEFWPTYALILLKKGAVDAVIRMAGAQLKRPGADDHWFYLLGEAFRQRQNLPRAAAFFSLYAKRAPDQIAPQAALVEIYSTLGMKQKQRSAALRLLFLVKQQRLKDVLEDFHLRYNSMGRDRIERIEKAVSGALCDVGGGS
jgi:tetratricopeptide (TPR) repeat protein